MNNGIAPNDQEQYLRMMAYANEWPMRNQEERTELFTAMSRDTTASLQALKDLAMTFAARAEATEEVAEHIKEAVRCYGVVTQALVKANETGESTDCVIADMMLEVFAKTARATCTQPSEYISDIQADIAQSNDAETSRYDQMVVDSYQQILKNIEGSWSRDIDCFDTCLDNIVNGIDEAFDESRMKPPQSDELWVENPNMGVGDLIPPPVADSDG